VGVWSLYRFGDPKAGRQAFRLALLRMLKISTHETGHMFSLLHCMAWLCGMCGSNSLPESDRHPLALCPECVAKICCPCRADPVDRYRKLLAFHRANGLTAEADACRRSIDALTPAASTRPATAALTSPSPAAKIPPYTQSPAGEPTREDRAISS